VRLGDEGDTHPSRLNATPLPLTPSVPSLVIFITLSPKDELAAKIKGEKGRQMPSNLSPGCHL